MASRYPVQIDNSSTLPTINSTTPITAGSINILRDAVVFVETELGIKPSGTFGTVRARLDNIDALLASIGASGIAGGDLSGTYPNPIVAKIQGNAVKAETEGTLQDGYVLTWVNDNSEWEAKPSSGGGGSGAVADDIAKSDGITINRVRGLRDVPLAGSDGDVPPIGGAWTYTTQGGSSFKADNPVPHGWHDIRHYGAIPSLIDTNSFDCTQAFLDAIAAASVINTIANGHGIVYVPPAGDGYEWYIAGTTNAAWNFKHLEISRTVRIKGVGTGSSPQNGSRIKFGLDCAGFRFVALSGSSDGGDASGAIVEGLSIFPTTLANTTIVRGWQSNHTYSVGDKIRPHRFHGFYYECLKGGVSSGPTPVIPHSAQNDCDKYANNAGRTSPRWAANHPYTAGDIIIQDQLLSTDQRYAFVANNTGTSGGSAPTFGTAIGDMFVDNDITWTTVSGNRWRPGIHFNVDDIIYPNTQNGQLFKCTVDGYTVGTSVSTAFNADSYSEAGAQTGRQPAIGEPGWIGSVSDPRGTILPSITEVDGPTWEPVNTPQTITSITGNAVSPIVITVPTHGFLDGYIVVVRGVSGNSNANITGKVANPTLNTFELQTLFGTPTTGNGAGSGGTVLLVSDPEPIWELDNPGHLCYADQWLPNHTYSVGAQVFGTGRFDIIFAATIGSGHTAVSGGTEPAGFATANVGDTFTDGLITWHGIDPIGVVPDGYCVWAARTGSAFVVNAPICEMNACYIQGSPTAAVCVLSMVGPGIFWAPDGTKMMGGTLFTNGIGIYCRGGDSNAGSFNNLFMVATEADFWLDPADHCIYDVSFLGNHYSHCFFQGCSGYAIGCMSQASSGTISQSYIEGQGRKSPLQGPIQVMGGTIGTDQFRLDGMDENSGGSGGGPSFFADGVVNHTSRSHFYPYTIWTSLKGDRKSALHWWSTNDISPGTNDDPNGYLIRWGIFANWWSFLHSSSSVPNFNLAGAGVDIGPGHIWMRAGYQLGQAELHYHFGDEPTARSDVKFHQHGSYMDRAGAASLGTYLHYVNVNSTNPSYYGQAWAPSIGYNPNAVVVPVGGAAKARGLAFRTDGGTSGMSEPIWPTVLAGTVSDNGMTWTAIQGVDLRYTGLIEDGYTGLGIQGTMKWADSSDTDADALIPKARVRARRRQVQTTTNAANQIIDDGYTFGSENFILPDNAITVIDATLFVKKDGYADAGSIRLSGTYYRDSGGIAINIPTDDNTAKLTAGLSTVTAALVIAGNAVQVQVSPGATLTLDWRLVRVQYEGVS